MEIRLMLAHIYTISTIELYITAPFLPLCIDKVLVFTVNVETLSLFTKLKMVF